MSCSKDFSLEIIPPISESVLGQPNLIKFNIKNRKSGVLDKIKIPLEIALFCLFLHELNSQVEYQDLKGLFTSLTYDISISNARILYWIFILMSILLISMKQEPEDSLIIIKDIGIQLISKRPWMFQKSRKEFVPLNTIIDLVIHEGFFSYGQVIFYLCILTKSNPSQKDGNPIKVVFPKFLPRKDILTKVLKLSRQTLFGENRRYWRHVPGHGLKQII